MLQVEETRREVGLLEVAGGSRLGGCLAAADGDGCVDCDHFGEDVEDRLELLSASVHFVTDYCVTYLGHRLVVDVDEFPRVGVDLQRAVEAQRGLDVVCACTRC
jgi:hypothetical protein